MSVLESRYGKWDDIPETYLRFTGKSNKALFTEDKVKEYFDLLVSELNMIPVTTPIFNYVDDLEVTTNEGVAHYHGMCAIQFWKTSGISLYTWNEKDKLSVCIHSCKHFNKFKVVEFSREFWKLSKFRYCGDSTKAWIVCEVNWGE